MPYFLDMSFRDMNRSDLEMYRLEVRNATHDACERIDQILDPGAYARKQERLHQWYRSMGAYHGIPIAGRDIAVEAWAQQQAMQCANMRQWAPGPFFIAGGPGWPLHRCTFR